LKIKSFHLLNDFEAAAYGILLVPDTAFISLKGKKVTRLNFGVSWDQERVWAVAPSSQPTFTTNSSSFCPLRAGTLTAPPSAMRLAASSNSYARIQPITIFPPSNPSAGCHPLYLQVLRPVTISKWGDRRTAKFGGDNHEDSDGKSPKMYKDTLSLFLEAICIRNRQLFGAAYVYGRLVFSG
jgi:hypothetical protein